MFCSFINVCLILHFFSRLLCFSIFTTWLRLALPCPRLATTASSLVTTATHWWSICPEVSLSPCPPMIPSSSTSPRSVGPHKQRNTLTVSVEWIWNMWWCGFLYFAPRSLWWKSTASRLKCGNWARVTCVSWQETVSWWVDFHTRWSGLSISY